MTLLRKGFNFFNLNEKCDLETKRENCIYNVKMKNKYKYSLIKFIFFISFYKI